MNRPDYVLGHGAPVASISSPAPFSFPLETLVHTPTAAYPDGNPKTALGMKKPDLSVVPPAGLLHLATAMMNGAQKYGPFNWRDQPISARTYVAAAMRHLLEYLDGADFSSDTISSGRPVHQLAHVMACCAIVLDAEAAGTLMDNRPTVKGPATRMIDAYNDNGRFDLAEGSDDRAAAVAGG
jgi:hypothetical protein